MEKFYFEMKRGLWSVAMLLGLLCSVSLASCGDDDDKPGGQSVTTDNLVGRSFRCDWADINDDNLPVEEHKEITFTSTTQCSIRSWGYDWVWYGSGMTLTRKKIITKLRPVHTQCPATR